ncbi:MAG: carboxymuconolactone decarboxylase family protein [Chitinophagia bacterium]|nr:carboxymuconolactone decarboxylase family protein [Chitinophagia bacterium]
MRNSFLRSTTLPFLYFTILGIPNIRTIAGCGYTSATVFFPTTGSQPTRKPSFSKSLEQGRLTPKVREAIALCVAGFNSCPYCTAAHSKIAKSCEIPHKEIEHNLKCKSEDPKTAVLLQFCHKVLEKRGHVADSDIETMLHHGFKEEELIEIVGVIALNITTNYFNNVFTPIVDF